MWSSGLWGWGPADAGEWQALYRVEGARRAWKARLERDEAAREFAERRARELAEYRAWLRSPERKAAEARRREELLAAGERASRLRLRARARSPVWAPGGRNYRIWQAYRAGGCSYRDIGREFGLSGSRCSQLVLAQQAVEDARAVTMAQTWRYRARQNLGRPIDLDTLEGTQRREVWLTYLPGPDPRLDNMVPVTSEDMR